MTIPTSLLIHLIATQNNQEHNRTTLMKKIGFSQDSLTVYISISFNIILAQVIDKYYLIVLHERTVTSGNIVTEIHPLYRCRSINELFPDKFVDQHLLKRIKYYQLPCQQRPDLVCFYDSNQFCLCTLDRTVDCFEFNHNMSYDCDGNNICQNKDLCFQDDSSCPTPPMCACQQCYFGSRCQFSTKESTLSLDIILGYHIMKQIQFNQQATIFKTAIILTIIIGTFGFINSLFMYYVFRSKEVQTVGCGLYLLVSSILSMIIIIILILKIIFLVLSQLDLINNRMFLLIQCIIIDFLLRFFLCISDWLSAFVAIERAINILQGVRFNKPKSKQSAKRMIVMIFIITGCSFLHDPIHRRLVHDEDEDYTWCISQYSSSVQTYDWILNTCHFISPFIINCISAIIIIIIIAARTRSNSHKNKTFKTHLYEQLRQHEHLLISLLILVVLATPRLFILFLSGCMKSARHSWIYMISYYISFIPSTMTFVVFVLPSDVYKKIFIDYIKQIRQ